MDKMDKMDKMDRIDRIERQQIDRIDKQDSQIRQIDRIDRQDRQIDRIDRQIGQIDSMIPVRTIENPSEKTSIARCTIYKERILRKIINEVFSKIYKNQIKNYKNKI